jgi:adenosylmethionine-8-amino-7-oxononanoate aminotransferase
MKGVALERHDVAGVQRVARRRVHHFAANFGRLERSFPGVYPRVFVAGDGAYLVDSTGHRVLDAGNHLGACVVGHSRPEVVAAIADQAGTLEFSSLEAGASHRAVATLATRLAGVVPVDDPLFYFTCSGSEANEVAIKVAREFHRRQGRAGRFKIMSRYGSYHGSSYAAMSATAIPGFREPFQPLVPGFVALPQPFPGECGFCPMGTTCTHACIDATVAAIERESPETVAAILAEPISIPGAVKTPPDDYWPTLRQVCDTYGILLIADEVVSGFGRTGAMFGVQHWGVKPDILTMAKGLTGGYVPMGAAAVDRSVAEAFRDEPLVHVNTYAGHALGCAAAGAVLDIIEQEDLVRNAAGAEDVLRDGLDRVSSHVPWTTRVQVRGLLASIEFVVPAGIDAEEVRARCWHECYEAGVVVRVTRAGQVVTLLFYPPLTVGRADLLAGIDHVTAAVCEVVRWGSTTVRDIGATAKAGA